MSVRTAAAVSVIPWLLLTGAVFGVLMWGGMIDNYGWPEFLRRFVPSVVLLYFAVVVMIMGSDRLFGRNTPEP